MQRGIYVYPESKSERFCVRISRRLTGDRDQKKRFAFDAYLPEGVESYASASTEQKADIRAAARKAAEEWAKERRKLIATPKQNILAFTNRQLGDAEEGFKILGGRASLAEAAKFYVAMKFPLGGQMGTSAAVTRWLGEKRKEGLSKAYVDKIEDTFLALAKHFRGNVHEITKEGLEAWISSRTTASGAPLSNSSWNHYRSDVLTLFNWCMSKGWMAHNPAAQLSERKAVKPEVGILTPPQALMLLRAAADQPGSPYLAFFVLSLYTGVRTAELERLNWSDVMLDDEPRVFLKAGAAKDQESRCVDISPNAVEWLNLVPFRNGPILPNRGLGVDRDHIAALRKVVGQWPRNAGRHSFVSYRIRTAGEFVAAEDAGHESVRITRNRYKKQVTRRAAEAWFALRPTTTDRQLADMLTPKGVAQAVAL